MEPHTSKRIRHAKGASTAAGTGGLATLVVWLLGHFHVSLSAEEGALLAGILSSCALFVWHNGLRHIGRHIIAGDEADSAVATQTT